MSCMPWKPNLLHHDMQSCLCTARSVSFRNSGACAALLDILHLHGYEKMHARKILLTTCVLSDLALQLAAWPCRQRKGADLPKISLSSQMIEAAHLPPPTWGSMIRVMHAQSASRNPCLAMPMHCPWNATCVFFEQTCLPKQKTACLP